MKTLPQTCGFYVLLRLLGSTFGQRMTSQLIAEDNQKQQIFSNV